MGRGALLGKLYICALCGDECEEGRTDEEAYQEAVLNFGPDPKDNSEFYDKVCNNCYRKIMDWVGKQDNPSKRTN